jgi:hypothetical protein
MKASEVQPGMTVLHPRGGMAIKVGSIVEVPEMRGRTVWYAEFNGREWGRGAYFAADVDDEIKLASDYEEA